MLPRPSRLATCSSRSTTNVLTDSYKNRLIDYLLRGQPLSASAGQLWLYVDEPDEYVSAQFQKGGKLLLPSANFWSSTSNPGALGISDGTSGVIYEIYASPYQNPKPAYVAAPDGYWGFPFNWVAQFSNLDGVETMVIKQKLTTPIKTFELPNIRLGIVRAHGQLSIEMFP